MKALNADTTLDIGRMQVLREVGRSGSIAAAARNLGLTASAVSQQISAFEKQLGLVLVERSSTGVVLTRAGAALSERARQVTDVLDGARADLEKLDDSPSGRVTVAAVASACVGLVSAAVSRLAVTAPGLEIVVRSLEPAESLTQLDAGSLDIAIIDEYDHVPMALPQGVVSHHLRTDRLIALDHVKSGRVGDSVSLKSLRGERLILPPDNAACGRAVRVACREQGFEPLVGWESDDMLVLTRAVADGHGVAIVPSMAIADHGSDVRELALVRPVLKRRLIALSRRSNAMRPSVRAVLDTLAAVPAG